MQKMFITLQNSPMIKWMTLPYDTKQQSRNLIRDSLVEISVEDCEESQEPILAGKLTQHSHSDHSITLSSEPTKNPWRSLSTKTSSELARTSSLQLSGTMLSTHTYYHFYMLKTVSKRAFCKTKVEVMINEFSKSDHHTRASPHSI